MVKSFSVAGVDSLGGANVKFPRIAYDKCSEVRVIDYYMISEEKKIESGRFFTCGSHELQTFVMDSSGNYTICEFVLTVNCGNKDKPDQGNN